MQSAEHFQHIESTKITASSLAYPDRKGSPTEYPFSLPVESMQYPENVNDDAEEVAESPRNIDTTSRPYTLRVINATSESDSTSRPSSPESSTMISAGHNDLIEDTQRKSLPKLPSSQLASGITPSLLEPLSESVILQEEDPEKYLTPTSTPTIRPLNVRNSSSGKTNSVGVGTPRRVDPGIPVSNREDMVSYPDRHEFVVETRVPSRSQTNTTVQTSSSREPSSSSHYSPVAETTDTTRTHFLQSAEAGTAVTDTSTHTAYPHPPSKQQQYLPDRQQPSTTADISFSQNARSRSTSISGFSNFSGVNEQIFNQDTRNPSPQPRIQATFQQFNENNMRPLMNERQIPYNEGMRPRTVHDNDGPGENAFGNTSSSVVPARHSLDILRSGNPINDKWDIVISQRQAADLLLKVVVMITGAGDGIGRDIAMEAGRKGAKLSLSSQSRHKLVTVSDSIQKMGRNEKILVYGGNLREERDFQKVITGTERKLGPVDVLINVWESGMNDPGVSPASSFDFKSTLLITSALLPKMMNNPHGGRIINVVDNPEFSPSSAMVCKFTESLNQQIAHTRYLNAEQERHPDQPLPGIKVFSILAPNAAEIIPFIASGKFDRYSGTLVPSPLRICVLPDFGEVAPVIPAKKKGNIFKNIFNFKKKGKNDVQNYSLPEPRAVHRIREEDRRPASFDPQFCNRPILTSENMNKSSIPVSLQKNEYLQHQGSQISEISQYRSSEPSESEPWAGRWYSHPNSEQNVLVNEHRQFGKSTSTPSNRGYEEYKRYSQDQQPTSNIGPGSAVGSEYSNTRRQFQPLLSNREEVNLPSDPGITSDYAKSGNMQQPERMSFENRSTHPLSYGNRFLGSDVGFSTRPPPALTGRASEGAQVGQVKNGNGGWDSGGIHPSPANETRDWNNWASGVVQTNQARDGNSDWALGVLQAIHSTDNDWGSQDMYASRAKDVEGSHLPENRQIQTNEERGAVTGSRGMDARPQNNGNSGRGGMQVSQLKEGKIFMPTSPVGVQTRQAQTDGNRGRNNEAIQAFPPREEYKHRVSGPMQTIQAIDNHSAWTSEGTKASETRDGNSGHLSGSMSPSQIRDRDIDPPSRGASANQSVNGNGDHASPVNAASPYISTDRDVSRVTLTNHPRPPAPFDESPPLPPLPREENMVSKRPFENTFAYGVQPPMNRPYFQIPRPPRDPVPVPSYGQDQSPSSGPVEAFSVNAGQVARRPYREVPNAPTHFVSYKQEESVGTRPIEPTSSRAGNALVRMPLHGQPTSPTNSIPKQAQRSIESTYVTSGQASVRPPFRKGPNSPTGSTPYRQEQSISREPIGASYANEAQAPVQPSFRQGPMSPTDSMPTRQEQSISTRPMESAAGNAGQALVRPPSGVGPRPPMDSISYRQEQSAAAAMRQGESTLRTTNEAQVRPSLQQGRSFTTDSITHRQESTTSREPIESVSANASQASMGPPFRPETRSPTDSMTYGREQATSTRPAESSAGNAGQALVRPPSGVGPRPPMDSISYRQEQSAAAAMIEVESTLRTTNEAQVRPSLQQGRSSTTDSIPHRQESTTLREPIEVSSANASQASMGPPFRPETRSPTDSMTYGQEQATSTRSVELSAGNAGQAPVGPPLRQETRSPTDPMPYRQVHSTRPIEPTGHAQVRPLLRQAPGSISDSMPHRSIGPNSSTVVQEVRPPFRQGRSPTNSIPYRQEQSTLRESIESYSANAGPGLGTGPFPKQPNFPTESMPYSQEQLVSTRSIEAASISSGQRAVRPVFRQELQRPSPPPSSVTPRFSPQSSMPVHPNQILKSSQPSQTWMSARRPPAPYYPGPASPKEPIVPPLQNDKYPNSGTVYSRSMAFLKEYSPRSNVTSISSGYFEGPPPPMRSIPSPQRPMSFDQPSMPGVNQVTSARISLPAIRPWAVNECQEVWVTPNRPFSSSGQIGSPYSNRRMSPSASSRLVVVPDQGQRSESHQGNGGQEGAQKDNDRIISERMNGRIHDRNVGNPSDEYSRYSSGPRTPAEILKTPRTPGERSNFAHKNHEATSFDLNTANNSHNGLTNSPGSLIANDSPARDHANMQKGVANPHEQNINDDSEIGYYNDQGYQEENGGGYYNSFQPQDQNQPWSDYSGGNMSNVMTNMTTRPPPAQQEISNGINESGIDNSRYYAAYEGIRPTPRGIPPLRPLSMVPQQDLRPYRSPNERGPEPRPPSSSKGGGLFKGRNRLSRRSDD